MTQLTRMLRGDDEQDFQSALGELLSISNDEAIGLLEQLAHEADGTFRSRALNGLEKIAPERAESLALQFLHDQEWFVRVDSINTLCRLDRRAAAPLIARLLATDPDELVRSWAAFCLGHLGDASVIPVLATTAEQDTGTDHEGRPIRDTALQSIDKIQSAGGTVK
ncbi:MAG: HEAT repeat domain-containing protein [Isosphaeraceae bacterium]